MITRTQHLAQLSERVHSRARIRPQWIFGKHRAVFVVFVLVASQISLGAGPDSPDQFTAIGHGAETRTPMTIRDDRISHGEGQSVAEDQILNDAGSAPVISYSLVEGGLSAGSVDDGGNLDANPLLANRNGADQIPGTVDDGVELRLQSPAIDAGSDALLPADEFDIDGDGDTTEPFPTDFNGRDRKYDDGGGAGTVDMGANERGATLVAVEPDAPKHAPELEFRQPFPNPISSRGTIRFTLPTSERVEVSVYDVLGRKRLSLFDAVTRPNEQNEVQIDATGLSNGLYFVRLRSASYDQSSNFVVVR